MKHCTTSRRSLRSLLLITVTPLVWAAPARAQSVAPAAQQPTALSDGTATQDTSGADIVVTALKSPGQRAIDAPAGISIVSGEKIAELNPSSLKDFLAQTPGLAVDIGIAGSQAIGIRGLNPSFGSASVGFYLDDLPFSFINVNILPDLSPFDLKSVEVLRGPQSSLYGAGASGGVIRLRTNDPDLSKASATVEGYGTATKSGDASYSVAGVVNLPLVRDRLAFRGSVQYQNLGGWIDDAYKAPGNDPDYGKNVNDEQKLVARGKLLLQATDNLSFEALANYSQDDTGMVPLADDARRFPKTFDTQSREKFQQYGFKAVWDLEAVSVTNTTGYIDLDRDFTYPDYAQFRQLASVKSFTNETTIASLGKQKLSWLAGIFYRHTRQNVDIDFSNAGLPFNLPDSAYASQVSIYGNATFALIPDRLEVAAGASYAIDRTDQVTRFVLNSVGQGFVAAGVPVSALLPPEQPGTRIKSDIFSPKVSVTFHPRERMSLYAVYSEGFRAGFNDNGFSTFFARQAIGAAGGNPAAVTGAVTPEKVKAYEVGAKAYFLNGLFYTELALFQNDLSNSQQSAVVADPTSGVTTNAAVNIGSARTRGVEALLDVKGPIRGTSLSLTASYIDARVTSNALVGNVLVFRKGDRLNGVPEWTVGASGNFRTAISGGAAHLSGFVSLLYTSPRYISQLGIAPFPGDPIVRMDARVQFEKGPVAFYVFGQNLTDENGRITPSVRSNPGYPGSVQNLGVPIVGLLGTRLRPRTLGVGARLSF